MFKSLLILCFMIFKISDGFVPTDTLILLKTRCMLCSNLRKCTYYPTDDVDFL